MARNEGPRFSRGWRKTGGGGVLRSSTSLRFTKNNRLRCAAAPIMGPKGSGPRLSKVGAVHYAPEGIPPSIFGPSRSDQEPMTESCRGSKLDGDFSAAAMAPIDFVVNTVPQHPGKKSSANGGVIFSPPTKDLFGTGAEFVSRPGRCYTAVREVFIREPDFGRKFSCGVLELRWGGGKRADSFGWLTGWCYSKPGKNPTKARPSIADSESRKYISSGGNGLWQNGPRDRNPVLVSV